MEIGRSPPTEMATLENATVGFLPACRGWTASPPADFCVMRGRMVRTDTALVEGVASGRFDVGMSELLTARHAAGGNGWRAQWLPRELGGVLPHRHWVVEGGLNLKAGGERAIERLEVHGKPAAVLDGYGVTPIEDACTPCSDGAG